MELSDGTIIPSYLGAGSPGAEMAFRSTGAKICFGEVKEIIYPKSKKSVSKKFIEYRVIIQDVDHMGRPYTTEFGNCYTSSFFGGVADKCRFTFRKQDKANSSGLGEGSKVVLVCLNGNSNNAIIIAGLRDGQNDKKEDPDENEGHHLRWEFNGLLGVIDKDGQFIIHRRGPTDAKGEVLKDYEDNGGAFIQLNQNGDVDLVDGGDGNNTFKLDHKNDTIDATAATGTANVTAKKDVTITSKDEKVSMVAPSVRIGSADADEAMILGNTQRNGVKQMHNAMKQNLQMAQQMLDQAGTQITQAAGLILPLTALPAKPGLIMAGQLLGQAAQALGKVKDAVDNYESNADKELSSKNYLDK